MMVMRRRAGESILIGDDIEIHIAEIGRSRVKIAIGAPREVPIVAKELKITAQENAAAVMAGSRAVAALAGRLRAGEHFFSNSAARRR
ncbi:MAG TPA: carbon storage regulator [Bryobacteraceae bacterium]|nr:carbon storage regulator [Bryobacteraceae bacterium]